MPDVQQTFIGDPTEERAQGPLDVIQCDGGCRRDLVRADLHNTPEGLLCQRCLDDLYIICADCGVMMRLNCWGECRDLQQGADGASRCHTCHDAVYSRCCHCGRFTPRSRHTIHTAPDDSSAEYCQRCWANCWFTCSDCGEVVDSMNRHNTPDNGDLCPDCFEAGYIACSSCECAVDRDNYEGWEGDPYCARCYGRAEVWMVQPWSGEATTFDCVGSTRRYGVELETDHCDDYRELHGTTDWGCVYECSTGGKEFISPILQGDEGFAAIEDICEYADDHNWRVSSSCGLHIHLDLSEESSDECLRIAYAYRKTYPLWKKFVRSQRTANSMCGSPQYDARDVRAAEHIEDFAESRDRFEFVNWRAYLRHGSFEVRVYQGTLSPREICNWIALHARFMDKVKALSFDEIDSLLGAITRKNWSGMCSLIDDQDLLNYWRRKASQGGHDLAALPTPDADTSDVDTSDADADTSDAGADTSDAGTSDADTSDTWYTGQVLSTPYRRHVELPRTWGVDSTSSSGW